MMNGLVHVIPALVGLGRVKKTTAALQCEGSRTCCETVAISIDAEESLVPGFRGAFVVNALSEYWWLLPR